jgi:SAM-dependent methyltransferase
VTRVPLANWAIREARDRWFDLRYHVHTAGFENVKQLHVRGGNLGHALSYEVSNPRTTRQILECLPIEDFSRYTFVDFGSGKGRVLLMAAEFPFRKIVGVEFATELHEIAVRNIQRYRNSKQQCFAIAAVNSDVADFPIPEGDCVLYFYNPFRAPVMRALVDRIDESVERNPRDIIIAFLNPETGHVFDETRHFRGIIEDRYFRIYRSTTAGVPLVP